jgi:hypothetical protein
MSTVSHQTIKLSKGKHSSPRDGACVMELASMLAGEKFTDHPESVCPAIGSFLRAYNDAVEDDRRQDLYAYASQVVGTRSCDEVERARAQRLLQWAAARQSRRWTRVLPPALRSIGSGRRPPIDACGTHAVRSIRRHSDATHAEVLALIDELIAIGAPAPDATAPASAERAEIVSIP